MKYDLDICECGHYRDMHEAPDDTRASSCTVDDCPCLTFDLDMSCAADEDEYDEF